MTVSRPNLCVFRIRQVPRKYLAEIGRNGGKVMTEKKRRALQKNARKKRPGRKKH
jgi:hypothetical protein